MTVKTNTRLAARPARLTRVKRPPFIAYASLFLLGLLTAAAMETLRDYITRWNQHELVRVTSADGQVDAVFAETIHPRLGGGTALYLVPKGDPVSPSEALFQGNGFTDPPKLLWRKPQLLEMVYGAGCISGFTSVWHSNVIEGGNYFVEVRLEPTRKFVCIADGPTKVSPDAQASTPAERGKAQ